MGLELVELCMMVEDEFNLVIPDEDTWEINTPRQFADYVTSRLELENKNKHSSYCISQMQFHKLRSILIKEFGVLRSNIRLKTPIAQLFQGGTEPQQLQQWNLLACAVEDTVKKSDKEQSVSATPAPTSKPKEIMFRVISWCIPASLLLFTLTFSSKVLELSTGIIFFILFMCLVIWIWSLEDKESYFEQQIKTKKTVRKLVSLIGIAKPSLDRKIDPNFVLHRILCLTSACLNIPMDQIRPDARFIEDLGAG